MAMAIDETRERGAVAQVIGDSSGNDLMLPRRPANAMLLSRTTSEPPTAPAASIVWMRPLVSRTGSASGVG